MLHDEITKALCVTPSAGLVLDRRHFDRTSLARKDLRTLGQWSLERFGTPVHATCVQALDPNSALRLSPQYVRRLDRFFLPAAVHAAPTAALFDIICDIYEDMADVALNTAVVGQLVLTVLETAPSPARILDFGCGTGLSALALLRLEPQRSTSLVGVDFSEGMLAYARRRGLEAQDLAQWRAQPDRYDGAVASFVLHYGTPADDLALLAARLRPGCRFAANLHGGSDRLLSNLRAIMAEGGAALEQQYHLRGAGTVHVFRKDEL